MRKLSIFVLGVVVCASIDAHAIMERGDYPWGSKLRSWYDKEMTDAFPEVPWLLNLGPTGIRARIYPEYADRLVVKYVFQDAQSPAKGKIVAEDVIVGANGKRFTTQHRFGRRLPGGGGWDGPMMELAGQLEDSQGADGVLRLTVWPQGEASEQRVVPIQLKPVGRFAKTFPYTCERSTRMLEELCDFIAMDYASSNWKSADSFYGSAHGEAHQLLALMASGLPKYDSIIRREMARFHDRRYDPTAGGFRMWKWGFDGIVMGEGYRLTKDTKLVPAMHSLTKAMPWGSFDANGIYTHRSHINIRRIGKKPYASIAAISGLQMIAMSVFKAEGLRYDAELYDSIHGHYLRSTSADAVNIAYAFGGHGSSSNGRDYRHVIIKIKDLSKGLSGKGPGYVCPDGMKGITDYEITWPTQADHRWKPTDWVAAEADENIVEELMGDIRRVNRFTGAPQRVPEPIAAYRTTKSGGHLAPVGMGAVAHTIGNADRPSWDYLGRHAANTCALAPGNAFDGHAASNLHGFWSVLGASRSDQPKTLRAYFDYMKTFLILSETHNGGLILQPWGRDRPNCNSDTSFGPRTLPTATGAILLSLPVKHLLITGADEDR